MDLGMEKGTQRGPEEDSSQTGLAGLLAWVAWGPGKGPRSLPSGHVLVPRLVSSLSLPGKRRKSWGPVAVPDRPKLLSPLGPGHCPLGWTQECLLKPALLPTGSPRPTEFPSGKPLGFLRPTGGSECSGLRAGWRVFSVVCRQLMGQFSLLREIAAG